MANRAQRITELENAVVDYVAKEKTRLENEASVLKGILSGRTGGKGMEKAATKVIAAAAQNDLAAYLRGS